jgi:outer membrane lipoprotein SlyB
MKITLMMVLCCAALFVSGCAAGISRTGYQLPTTQITKDLPRRPIVIQCNVHYNTNDVEILGSIHDYDTGFSTDCDEAAILDIFCREGSMLGADLINITEEKQPSIWTSTCYRAKAEFLRFKDREKVKGLVSDAKYAPDLIIKRSVAAGKRNREVIAGAVFGGILGAIIVSAVTDPNHHSNHTNSVPEKEVKKP